MSDAPELTLWQIAQYTGLAAVVGFAGEAMRRAFGLGGKVALIEKALADQKAINDETREALKNSLAAYYELKTSLASLATREEIRQMLVDFKNDMRPRRST